MTADAEKPVEPARTGKRARSGTASPYFDLESSIKVAQTIHGAGGGSCTSDQLAHWLSYKSTRSGTYLTRIAAARHFGLIESSNDRHVVTERGMRIIAPVMSNDAIQAKVDAFMEIELFSKVYQRFRGTALPSDSGLKNLFATPEYAILSDRIDVAVRVLINSAEQAGLLVGAGDQRRVIVPSLASGTAPAATPKPTDEAPTHAASPADKPRVWGQAPTENPGGVHSAIVGLLRELPPPGTPWPASKKQRFLTAFQSTIDFIYPEDEP